MSTSAPRDPLSPERWRRIDELLDRLLDADPRRVRELLDRECAGDADLRRQVESLLAAERTAPSFLDAGAAEFAAPALEVEGAGEPDQTGGGAAGVRLGPWELVHEIGHGGMSVVWLAERADGQFSKQVAIKLLRHPGRGRSEFAERFRIERQILASLEHPNIARVLDGGVGEDGMPFLALEYVDGVPLTRYCRERGLTIEQRLELFEDVCAAVQHAHQRLVVHRDLKPSNTLVVPPSPGDAGPGTVKLLDFGIAKLLDEDAGPGQPATRTGLLLMTPEYAAPEQVTGGEITTATDVYALGVVLYELLAGERPYRLENYSASEIERAICEKQPARPSTVAARTETGARAARAESDAGAARAGSDAGAARGRRRATAGLDADLDAIVLRALAKEPARRYGSARELADDLRRFAEGRPVEARVPTRRYLLARFLRRHRLAAITAAVFLLTLVASAVTLSLQQRATLRERDRAREEAETARAVTDYLVSLFEAGDPSVSKGEKLTAQELLARGADQAASLDEEPLVQARLFDAIGRAYRNLGEYEASAPLVERSVRLLRENPERDRTQLAVALNQLAVLRRHQGQYEEARALYEEALAAYEHDGNVAEAAVVRANLGYLLMRLDQTDEAESLLRRALDEMGRTRPPDDPKIADALSKLARIAYSRGDYQAAAIPARRALEIARRSLGRHPRTAGLASNLAVMLRRSGDLDGAERLYEEAYEIQREILGEKHPSLAITLANRAQLLKVRQRYAEAEPLLRRALAILNEALGEKNRKTAQAMANLSGVLAQLDRPQEAERLARRALAIRRELLGDDSPDVAHSLQGLGLLLEQQGRLDEARATLDEAHAIRLSRGSAGDSRTASVSLDLGRVLAELGERDAARAQLERTARAVDERAGHDDALLGRLRALLGTLNEISGPSLPSQSDADGPRAEDR